MKPVAKKEEVEHPVGKERGYYRLCYHCPACGLQLFHETYDSQRCFGAGSCLFEVRRPAFCPDCGTEIEWNE